MARIVVNDASSILLRNFADHFTNIQHCKFGHPVGDTVRRDSRGGLRVCMISMINEM